MSVKVIARKLTLNVKESLIEAINSYIDWCKSYYKLN